MRAVNHPALPRVLVGTEQAVKKILARWALRVLRTQQLEQMIENPRNPHDPISKHPE